MRSLLFMSAAIAIVAVSAPDLITRYTQGPPGEGRDAPKAAVSTTGAVRASSGARQVEIEAHRDGHFYVDAEINSRPVRLMVDTGASVVALRQSDAEAAGLRPRGADFDRPVSTANGVAYAAAADLGSISVSDIELKGVPALILPDEQLNVSLLGGSFLNRLERFQVQSGTLIFEN